MTKNINEEEFENFVFLIGLENAVSFKGKANPKALIGKIIPKYPTIKNDMKYYQNLIENIINQINNLDFKEQKKKLEKLNPKFFKKKEKPTKKIQGLPDLPNHEGLFIGRFSPAPSGYLHIGHLFNLVYNFEYKKKYGGKFIIRFEDTNPQKIAKENYEKILEDIKWITDNNIDEVYYQSNRLNIYYQYLRQLIDTGFAYVCECEPQTFKNYNDSSKPCPHRDLNQIEQIENYEKFFNGKYKDGDACIRFKADLENKNPALRDIPIARLNSNKHPLCENKYRLWPMYNFCTAIDDSLMGINYIVRGKDSEINAIRQDMIKDAIGLKKSKYFHFGRLNFTDVELGKTPIKEKIERGIYTGWDDPRVPTLVSFKKRGFKAKAFRDMLIAKGISKRDSKISEKEYFKSINYYNKQILEKEANRFFFIHNPKKVIINDISKYPKKEIILPKHPDFKERGNRKFELKNKYLIDSIDFNNLNVNDKIRLMHFANFKITKKEKDEIYLDYISKEYDKSLNVKANIHFIPNNLKEINESTIIMQDNSKIKGFTEKLQNPKIGTPIQFERFGFVRFDSLDKNAKRIFYFTHR